MCGWAGEFSEVHNESARQKQVKWAVHEWENTKSNDAKLFINSNEDCGKPY
jgi:hypothetical protein